MKLLEALQRDRLNGTWTGACRISQHQGHFVYAKSHRHAGVGTSNPEELWRLLVCQATEEIWLLLLHPCSPFPAQSESNQITGWGNTEGYFVVHLAWKIFVDIVAVQNQHTMPSVDAGTSEPLPVVLKNPVDRHT